MKQVSENEDSVITAVAPVGENGNNGDEHQPPEMKAARELARRYRLPFVDLLPPDRESPIDYDLFTEVPVDLMVRHQFVPLKRDQKGLHIAMADPTDLERLDELSSTLRTRVDSTRRDGRRRRSSAAKGRHHSARTSGSSLRISYFSRQRNRARRGSA